MSIFDNMTSEQKEAALNYKGEESFGDPRWRIDNKKVKSMKMIYKYSLGNPYHNLVSIEKMPKGAKVLDAQMQGDELVLWALVNPKHSEKEKTFHIYGTGFELTEYEKKHYDYLKTVQTAHGLVWHVFEVFE